MWSRVAGILMSVIPFLHNSTLDDILAVVEVGAQINSLGPGESTEPIRITSVPDGNTAEGAGAIARVLVRMLQHVSGATIDTVKAVMTLTQEAAAGASPDPVNLASISEHGNTYQIWTAIRHELGKLVLWVSVKRA